MQKLNILLVDDEINIIKSLMRIISKENYNIEYTENPKQALSIIDKGNVDIIICDQNMPNILGIEILNYAKRVSPNTVRILMTGYQDFDVITSAINNEKIFCYISKPWKNDQLLMNLNDASNWIKDHRENDMIMSNLLSQKENWINAISKINNQNNYESQNIVNLLSKIIKAKDIALYEHSKRTSKYSIIIADLLGLSDTQKTLLKNASLFHDIGKISIRDGVLYKKDKLNYDEYQEIKKHPIIGAEIIDELEGFGDVCKIVLQHHEWVNGQGYPFGINSNELELESKILAIADVYDALTSDRVYKCSYNNSSVKDKMIRQSGTHFDSNILEIFLNKMEEQEINNYQ